MAHQLFTIKKRAIFVHVRNNGTFIRSKNINLQKLINQDLDNKIGVGYTATKKIGNAVKRNKAKRIMRELAKKILINGKINTYYVLIAKISILDTKFKNLLEELDKSVNIK
ncbi:MAG: ribonuclease P protein component [Pelagibacteraceae bacterium]|jgi:ribonuclease P protein component|nr:ribonuclease P protein component [Pelagibacteraceae bacterium]MBT3903048.1 ribonuclease P protein component [Pelagibacteraceae bacterium]MBT4645426.1 ribonuclease P protein component [Pelagibacteraceae bacterium]MBT5214363.1 ribonuclease P protein component [Pelagibacteraceae bacterium]MBT6197837.1 ribonuclease P protein component [Pelagibacteraceae bacterium]